MKRASSAPSSSPYSKHLVERPSRRLRSFLLWALLVVLRTAMFVARDAHALLRRTELIILAMTLERTVRDWPSDTAYDHSKDIQTETPALRVNAAQPIFSPRAAAHSILNVVGFYSRRQPHNGQRGLAAALPHLKQWHISRVVSFICAFPASYCTVQTL